MWLGSKNDIEGPSINTMGPRERTFDEVLQLVSPWVGHDSKAQCDTAFIGKLTSHQIDSMLWTQNGTYLR